MGSQSSLVCISLEAQSVEYFLNPVLHFDFSVYIHNPFLNWIIVLFCFFTASFLCSRYILDIRSLLEVEWVKVSPTL